MDIVNIGADYSQLGLGSSNWVLTYASKAGVTEPAKRAALQKLYDDAVAANLWDKIDVIAPFAGSTAATQKFLFDPEVRELSFVGAPVHSAAGFKPNRAGAAITPYILPTGSVTQFSMGYVVSEEEPEPLSAQANSISIGMGVFMADTPDDNVDVNVELSRNYQYQNQIVLGAVGRQTSPGFRYVNKPTPNLGFLQISREGLLQSLISNSTVLVSTAQSSYIAEPIGGRNIKLALGAQTINTGNGIQFPSVANQSFAYVGRLTKDECLTWNGIVQSFLTAFGR